MGLGKNVYFERLESAHPKYFAYILYRMRRGKPGGSTPFYVPEKYNFILEPSKKHPHLWVMRRRTIQQLRKNNPLKAAYLQLRAVKLF